MQLRIGYLRYVRLTCALMYEYGCRVNDITLCSQLQVVKPVRTTLKDNKLQYQHTRNTQGQENSSSEHRCLDSSLLLSPVDLGSSPLPPLQQC